jgi:type 1 glutamine amidotransferase
VKQPKDTDDTFKAKQEAYSTALADYNAENKVWNDKIKAYMADKMAMDKIKDYDGFVFANTTGDLPLPDKEGFIKWIEAGHAFMGMHSASDTFHQFKGYIDMLQGEFETHKAQVAADLIAGDTAHPANGGIGASWNLVQEEMYHIKSQDRSKVRTLWFMRHDPNVVTEQKFFPVSWCRKAGEGRVFYTSLGHREDLWSDSLEIKDRKNSVELSKQYQAHILGGIKWALGLADGSAEPNLEVK